MLLLQEFSAGAGVPHLWSILCWRGWALHNPPTKGWVATLQMNGGKQLKPEREYFLLHCNSHKSVQATPARAVLSWNNLKCAANVQRWALTAILCLLQGHHFWATWNDLTASLAGSKLFSSASQWLHLSAIPPVGFKPGGWMIQFPKLPGGNSAHCWP